MTRAGFASLFDLFMSSDPTSARLATVRRSAEFDWFALMEIERASTANGDVVLRFDPNAGRPSRNRLETGCA